MVFGCGPHANPLNYVNAVRDLVRRADRAAPVRREEPTARIDQTINQEITFARLCTGFAMLALVIACVGLYGTVATRSPAGPARSASGWRSGRNAPGRLDGAARGVAAGGVGRAIGVGAALGRQNWWNRSSLG